MIAALAYERLSALDNAFLVAEKPSVHMHVGAVQIFAAGSLKNPDGQCGLGIALFSYDGALCWGFNASYELVPDLAAFVGATAESFRELGEAFGVRPQCPAEPAEAEPPANSADGGTASAASGIAAALG